MIELYLSKVTETSETEQAGKLYARVSYKQAMDIHDMAHHMAEHNTASRWASTNFVPKKVFHVKYSSKRSDNLRFFCIFAMSLMIFACLELQH